MTFLGQWKTDTGFNVNLTESDGHRSRGVIEGVPSHTIEFDSDGYPVDQPHEHTHYVIGKLMIRRRGEEQW